MGMHKDQLRALIRDVLSKANLWSQEAEDLLMLTAAVESNLGEYIRQIGGPARGIFQMEPATERDIWTNYIKYNTDFEDMIYDLVGDGWIEKKLEGDLIYQIIMTRLHYLRVPKPIPSDLMGQAEYWKKYYNTPLGKGTVEKAVDAWFRYVEA